MPIHASQFKKIIIKSLKLNHPDPLSVNELYRVAENSFQFDQHDLRATTVRSKSTKEPSWKRSLRNCLQGLKSNGEAVNSPAGYWRLPPANCETFLQPEEAWTLIKNAAKVAYQKKSVWESTKQGRKYEVASIEESKIGIRRYSTETIEYLLRSDVIRGINSLNAAGGRVGRRAMIYTVAKEVAIVYLHPNLGWDNEYEFIIFHPSTSPDYLNTLVTKFEEAKNDDINALQITARRIRKGQRKLRDNLLKAYSGKCCISKTGPENVLQAAHIDAHSESGNNNSTNALLLRSDLHDLFDDGLLLIEPRTLIVKINPKLKGTYYYRYDGWKLVERLDKLSPNIEHLTKKWVENYWSK